MTDSGRIRPLFEEKGFLPLLKTGRWALAGIETLLSVALILWYPNRPAGAYAAMAFLLWLIAADHVRKIWLKTVLISYGLFGLLTAPFLKVSFTYSGDLLAVLAIVVGVLLLLQR